jgi:hypothetical protein
VLWAPKAWVGLRCLVVADVNCGSLRCTQEIEWFIKAFKHTSIRSGWLRVMAAYVSDLA